MIAVTRAAIVGIEAVAIQVEIDIRPGRQRLRSSDWRAAVKESRKGSVLL